MNLQHRPFRNLPRFVNVIHLPVRKRPSVPMPEGHVGELIETVPFGATKRSERRRSTSAEIASVRMSEERKWGRK